MPPREVREKLVLVDDAEVRLLLDVLVEVGALRSTSFAQDHGPRCSSGVDAAHAEGGVTKSAGLGTAYFLRPLAQAALLLSRKQEDDEADAEHGYPEPDVAAYGASAHPEAE